MPDPTPDSGLGRAPVGDRARAAASALSAWLEDIYASLDRLGARLAPEVAKLLARGTPVTVGPDHSARIREAVRDFIAAVPVADGAGLVLPHELLQPETAELQWWRREARGITRTEFNLNPALDGYYDYANLDWFARPVRDGTAALAGPYIDYLGIDYYICTASVPLVVAGDRRGIVGCDIRMQDLEREVLPRLHELPSAALLGRTRQVLVGNSGRLATGVLVAAIPAGFDTVRLAAGDAGLELLYRT